MTASLHSLKAVDAQNKLRMGNVLNEKYNEWYKNELRTFIIENDVKNHPERIKGFKFDLIQMKIDTCRITDEEVVMAGVKSHLQTDADILCIGRRTVYDNINYEY